MKKYFMLDSLFSSNSNPTANLVAGCDEVGRGCLAGPVVAAAVILPFNFPFLLKDSKQLTVKQRLFLSAAIREEALDWAIGFVTPQEIDKINIANATYVAMHRAIDKLKIKPTLLLIDGNRFKAYPNIKHQCIVRGDQQHSSIAAASVIAKVYRDQYMQELSVQIPGYHWEYNMGYPTLDHRKAIEALGNTSHHRKSFRQAGQVD